MAKKNFTVGIAQTIAHSAAVETLTGLRLSDVIQEVPKKLRANPLNSNFFSEETSEYFENLRQDVKERGILVPLVARQDGTLLAGHNRLRIAKELQLSLVPVQYVLDELSEDAERKFVINDNLLRRQLTGAERITLYRILYPNFDTRLNARTNGRPKVTDKSFSSKKGEGFPLSDSENEKPLNAGIIARDTGQSRETVKKQLQQYKKEQVEPHQQQNQEQVSKKNPPQMLLDSSLSHTVDTGIIKKIERDLLKAEEANDVTRKEVVKKLKAFLKKLT
jgi:ParB-like chromosome segregation protein Spo0J